MDELKQCQECGNDLVYSGRGRPPTQYCSRKCKDAVRGRARREAALANCGERRCYICDAVIPESVTLKARCCSRKCSERYQNKKRADDKHARILASRKPCPGCGGELSENLSSRWKYCSTACKKKHYGALWRAKSPGYMRSYLYGITEDEYASMMERQGNACAICRSSEWPGKGNRPHVDHDHATGKIRQLLCTRCNTGLGQFDDDPSRLRAAAEYLERHM
jgi:hypothetical protein